MGINIQFYVDDGDITAFLQYAKGMWRWSIRKGIQHSLNILHRYLNAQFSFWRTKPRFWIEMETSPREATGWLISDSKILKWVDQGTQPKARRAKPHSAMPIRNYHPSTEPHSPSAGAHWYEEEVRLRRLVVQHIEARHFLQAVLIQHQYELQTDAYDVIIHDLYAKGKYEALGGIL